MNSIDSGNRRVVLLKMTAPKSVFDLGAVQKYLDVFSVRPYTMPCAIMALATFMKPATFAPFT